MKFSQQSVLIFLVFIIGCTQKQKRNKETTDRIQHSVEENFNIKNNTIDWQTYASEESDFSVKFPQNWESELFKIGNVQRIINIYPVNAGDSLDFPLTIHEKPGLSFISIFPDGYGTELPSGKSSSIERNGDKPVAIDINMKESLAFLIENNQAWGYFIVPASPPASWNEHGFIFAQIAVNDFKIKCFDKESGKELNMSECNPLLGDSVKRYGNVNQEDWATIKKILKTIKFKENKDNDQPQSGNSTNEIIVTEPLPGSVISSPLEITGKARGSWYFEALIEIELLKNGKTLASTVGKANGNWMTNDYVDFSATLKFPKVNESGNAELLFKNSNPSGKKELEKVFSIPVIVEE